MGQDLDSKHARQAFWALVVAWILAVLLLVRCVQADSTGMFPFIRVDGQSTTLVPIPFKEGLNANASGNDGVSYFGTLSGISSTITTLSGSARLISALVQDEADPSVYGTNATATYLGYSGSASNRKHAAQRIVTETLSGSGNLTSSLYGLAGLEILSNHVSGSDISNWVGLYISAQMDFSTADTYRAIHIAGQTGTGSSQSIQEFIGLDITPPTLANQYTGINIAKGTSPNGNVGLNLEGTLNYLQFGTNFISIYRNATSRLVYNALSGHEFLQSIYLANGSVSSPAIRFTGDTNNGIYYIGADNWGLSAGGANQVGLDTSGVTIPNALIVQGSTTLATSLTGILKATSGLVATASSSDLLTAIGTVDISANTNLAVTSPITLTGDTLGFDWSEMGVVMLKSDDGTTTFYRPSADTDTARGTALSDAFAAHAAGDTILVGPGAYEMKGGALTLEEGASLIGLGRPLIYAAGIGDALIRLVNNNVLVQGIDTETDAVGFGVVSATPITVSGIVLRDVTHTPTSASNTSGLQFTQSIGGGAAEHTVGLSAYDSKFYGGSTLGYGVIMSLDDGSVVNLWNCDVYGATDGILNRTTTGTSTGTTNIYGGTYRSVLDAITSGGGVSNVINVYGATAYGDQADIYGDDGRVNIYWANYRTEYAVGNGINQATVSNVMGFHHIIAGQLTLGDFGAPADVGFARNSAGVARVSNASSGLGGLVAGAATLTSLAITADSSQIVLDSDAGSGITTVLQDSAASSSKTITLPNVTGTLASLANLAQTFSGAITFNSTSGIALSSTSPILTFTDTTASEDDFTLSTASGGFQLVNTTDSVTAFSISGGGINTYNVATGQYHVFNVNNAEEARIAANRLTFNNGSGDTYIDWSTDGQLYVGGGIFRATGTAVVQSTAFTPYASGYELSVQSNSTVTYIEILNSNGTNTGAFFGAENDMFTLYNWNGNSAGSGEYPYVFFGGWGSVELLRLDRQTGTGFNIVGNDVDFRVSGNTLAYALFLDASAATENIALVTTAPPNWQTMDRGLFIGNATTVPTGNPTGGGFLYVEAGALKYRGTSGTITTLGPA